MSILNNKSLTHKRKRLYVFKSWRRNISGKEKLIAKQLKKVKVDEANLL